MPAGAQSQTPIQAECQPKAVLTAVTALQDGPGHSTRAGTSAHATVHKEPSHLKTSQAQAVGLPSPCLPCMAPQGWAMLHGSVTSSRTFLWPQAGTESPYSKGKCSPMSVNP